MSFIDFINDGDIETNPVTLDGLGESLLVRSGGSLQTGDQNSVVTEGALNTVVVEDEASIESDETAIEANGLASIIFNQGLISGGFNGVSATGNRFRLINRGTITSDSRAVDISDGDGSVVINSGSILGTDDQRNGTLYVDGTVDYFRLLNQRSGVIDAGEHNLGDAVSVQVGAAADPTSTGIHIVNNGLFQGRGDGSAVFADGARVNANGSSGLRFFNGSGNPETSVNGAVINNGTITAEVNVGFLGGLVVEDGVGFNGQIVNGRDGLINGPRNGLYIGDADHDLTIRNFGTIQSGSRAVNIDGSGVDLHNLGQILGTGNQRNGTVYADSTAEDYSIFNGRSGLIDAGEGNNGAGVSLQTGDEDGDIVEASLRNDGIIQGRGDGTGNQAGDGVRLFTSVTGSTALSGDLDNRGHILGTDDGIDIQVGVTLDGDINNTGLIKADEIGIKISGALNGELNNQGTITGGAAAIDASAATADITIHNQGEINGDVILSNFDDIFSGAEGTVNGVIDGGGGNDRLIGSRQNENFVGGDGQDTFVFGTNSGTDFILDFSTSTVNEIDVLDFSSIFSDIDEILGVGGAATQVGTSTLIDLGNNDSVFLVNVSVNDLTADNFIL